MNKTKLCYSGNCELKDADIAFFPMADISIVDSLHNIPEEAIDQKIIGVAQLPPVVLNRIRLRWDNGKTFTPNNVPLEFSFFNFDQRLSVSAIYKSWDNLIFHLQKNGFPAMWIITPQYICDFFVPKCIEGQGMFYYHNPCPGIGGRYSLITQDKSIHTYPLQEKNLLCLS